MTENLAMERVALADLHPHPMNARQGNVAMLVESLTELAQYAPITVNRGNRTGRPNEILAGHHLVKAAAQLGWPSIKVAYVDVDEDTAKKIMLVDNRSSDLAGYDQQLLADLLAALPDLDGTGYSTADLDALLTELNPPEPPAPPPPKPRRFAGGTAPVTVHRGDCITVMKTLAENSVDAIVTDPPYGLGFMGKEWDSAAALASRPPSADETDARFNNAYPRTGKGPSAVVFDGVAFQHWCTEWATEARRVLKPGGHLVAFGGTRTWHRLACAVEDAGFEMRDSLAWLYGEGFPKSLDVSKAIDKAGHLSRPRALEFTEWMRSTGITAAQINEATGTHMGTHYLTDKQQPAVAVADLFDLLRPLLPEVPERIERLVAERTGLTWADYKARPVVAAGFRIDRGLGAVNYGPGNLGGHYDITAPATDAARQWQGWGTALKPAFEPIVLARKPFPGTVAENVQAWGTGAINVDGCRIEMSDADRATINGMGGFGTAGWTPTAEAQAAGVYEGRADGALASIGAKAHDAGRWPANVALDESMAAVLDEQSGIRPSTGSPTHPAIPTTYSNSEGYGGGIGKVQGALYSDTGGASRFFYCAKADSAERPGHTTDDGDDIAHPTVKPLDLMRWLVRLITPPDGLVLDPFAGSGTTLEAARAEGFPSLGIEREADYIELIKNRFTDPPIILG